MSSVCQKCALRLQRAARADSLPFHRHSFSSTSTRRQQVALPVFRESSNQELNDVLSNLREKHFIPAYLHKQERKLIFGEKFRQRLEDNPPSTRIGDEEVVLKWIDRVKDIPNRSKLLTRAINLILDGESQDWENLPKLLQGMHEGVKKPLSDAQLEKIIRRAVHNDKFGIIIQCLQEAHRTGLTLKNEVVLRSVLVGIREVATIKQWQEGATQRALKYVNVVAQLLETDEHGTGRRLADNDPRMRLEVLSLFLELAAVYTHKYANSKDSHGLVNAYAGRLASQLETRGTQPQNLSLETSQRQWPMLTAIPIWHSLSVAQTILGQAMPKQSLVKQVIENYHSVLSRMAGDLEASGSDAAYYDKEALMAWNVCKEV